MYLFTESILGEDFNPFQTQCVIKIVILFS